MKQLVVASKRRQSKGALCWSLIVIGLLYTILSPNQQVSCQEFEDLNNQQHGRRPTNGGGNMQFAPTVQQQFQQQFLNNRQFNAPITSPQAASSASFAQQQSPSMQPNSLLNPNQQQQQQQATLAALNSQRLAASSQSPFQRANVPSRFGSTANSVGLANPQAASTQVQTVVTAPQTSPLGALPSVNNNQEQLMKAALARSTKLEPESRQDPPEASGDSLQSRQGSQALSGQQMHSTSRPLSQTTSRQAQSTEAESSPSSSASASSTQAEISETSADSATTTGSHETVYSNQRFANLFARRKTLNKAKFTPVESTRAKPTLPSFIKSPPDPKQFTPSDVFEGGSGASAAPLRPVAAASSANLVASRPSNNPTNRSNSVQQQLKKSASNPSANNNSNIKKSNAPNGKQTTGNANQKANLKDPKSPAVTPSLAAKPASNNPFSRGNSGSDQANVIAMARKRLLANNALESVKLRQQQQISKQAAAAAN